MQPPDLTPDCERFRGELSAHLYCELPAEARAAVERHLAGCAPCRDELAALEDTRKLLDRWETPTVVEDPRLLARAIAGLSAPTHRPRGRPRGRLVRLGALVTGAAAALFLALCLLSTEAELQGHRLSLSFALPGTAPSARKAALTPELESRLRTIAAQEVSAYGADLEHSQERLFQRCSVMTREELLRLSQAVDLALVENQRAVNSRLATLKREADVNDLAQRQAISSLATYLRPASNPNR